MSIDDVMRHWTGSRAWHWPTMQWSSRSMLALWPSFEPCNNDGEQEWHTEDSKAPIQVAIPKTTPSTFALELVPLWFNTKSSTVPAQTVKFGVAKIACCMFWRYRSRSICARRPCMTMRERERERSWEGKTMLFRQELVITVQLQSRKSTFLFPLILL